MKTNNEIVLEYYDTIQSAYLDDDCKQEIYLAILETDNKKLNFLLERGELTKWVFGLIKIMSKCKNSEYNKKKLKEILWTDLTLYSEDELN